jgi:hypothetical protein
LEEREIPVVEIHQGRGQLAEVFRDVIKLRNEVRNTSEDVPEPSFCETTLPEGGGTVKELGSHLVAVIHRVVEALLEVLGVDDLVHLNDVHEVLRRVFWDRRGFLTGLGAGHIEDVENEHGVVGDDGAAGLGDEIWVLHAGFIANL